MVFFFFTKSKQCRLWAVANLSIITFFSSQFVQQKKLLFCWSVTTVGLFLVLVHFPLTISTSFLRHIVHESIYFMSFLMSDLKWIIIMFLNCNSLPQKRLYFKRRVSHNIKQNWSILHCNCFFYFLCMVTRADTEMIFGQIFVFVALLCGIICLNHLNEWDCFYCATNQI